MSTRWWAPVRPATSPDAVVLVLLSKGDSNSLGTALLAAHRAGAGALEAVAKAAVPSEVSLVRGMVASRSAISDLVVDAASASMESSYAGLFTRDFFDDAEQGALTLYKTAVAKGVSPPVAASRVAAVYGVPFKQLGLYTSMATDPKSNPIALVDAADRALLGYFSKVVKAETKEDVSKQAVALATAEPPPRRRSATLERWDTREHPRDAQGQFAVTADDVESMVEDQSDLDRLKEFLGLAAAPAVDTGEVETAKPKGKLKRAVRRTRRASRVTTTSAEPRRETRTPQITSLAYRTTYQTQTRKAAAKVLEKTDPGLTTGLRFTAEALKPIADTSGRDYQEVKDKVAFYLAGEEGKKFRTSMAGTMTEAVFKIGHLSKLTPAANIDPDREGRVEAAEQLAHMAGVAKVGDVNPVTAKPVEETDIKIALSTSGMDVEEVIDQARLFEARKVTGIAPDGERIREVDEDELNNIRAAVDYATRNDAYEKTLIVHSHAHMGADPKVKRDYPLVHEFVIEGGLEADIEGVTESSDTDKRIVPNPNQYFKTENFRLYFDRDLEVFIARYVLKATTEEDAYQIWGKRGFKEPTSKALATLERTAFNRVHQRDEDGQFATMAAALSDDDIVTDEELHAFLSPQAKPQRRMQRTERRSRRPGKVQAAQAQPAFDTTVGLSPEVDSKVRSARAQRTYTRPARARKTEAAVEAGLRDAVGGEGTLKLSEAKIYAVLTKREFQDFLIAQAVTSGPHGAKLTSIGHQQLKQMSTLSGESAKARIAEKVRNQVLGPDDLEWTGEMIKVTGDWEKDLPVITETVKALFKDREHLTYAQLEPTSADPVGWENAYDEAEDLDLFEHGDMATVDYKIMGNRKALDKLVIIQLEDLAWGDDDVDLLPMGEFTASQVKVERWPEEDESIETFIFGGINDTPVTFIKAKLDKTRLARTQEPQEPPHLS